MYDYDALYRDTVPPWEIGRPQPALAAVVEHEVKGPRVLDLGCGTGALAVALARRGFDVTGVDVSAVAVEKARATAATAGVNVHFEVRDATRFAAVPYDSIFDSGLLHNLHRSGDDSEARYLALLPRLAATGARLFVLAVSVRAGQGWGLTGEYLRTAFGEPEWVGTTVEEAEVAAVVDGAPLPLAACLVRSQRAA